MRLSQTHTSLPAALWSKCGSASVTSWAFPSSSVLWPWTTFAAENCDVHGPTSHLGRARPWGHSRAPPKACFPQPGICHLDGLAQNWLVAEDRRGKQTVAGKNQNGGKKFRIFCICSVCPDTVGRPGTRLCVAGGHGQSGWRGRGCCHHPPWGGHSARRQCPVSPLTQGGPCPCEWIFHGSGFLTFFHILKFISRTFSPNETFCMEPGCTNQREAERPCVWGGAQSGASPEAAPPWTWPLGGQWDIPCHRQLLHMQQRQGLLVGGGAASGQSVALWTRPSALGKHSTPHNLIRGILLLPQEQLPSESRGYWRPRKQGWGAAGAASGGDQRPRPREPAWHPVAVPAPFTMSPAPA